MDSDDNEVVIDLSPVIRVYKNGHIERIFGSPYVPPSPEDSATGVSSKDINISSDLKARIYLPKLSNYQKLPILVYYHGGGFCIGSAFALLAQRYCFLLASEANVVIVSVEYKLAPEYPLPAAYEDSWTALQWVASHVLENPNIEKEAWLINYGDFSKVFIGGDSAGANIVHNIALRAGVEQLINGTRVKILGAILCFPYFLSSNEDSVNSLLSKIWVFVNPLGKNGIDDPNINPLVDENVSRITRLGCSRMLVFVAEKDELRNLGICYVEAVKKSGWNGKVELVDVEGEDHCFQVFDPECEKATYVINCIANFINQ